MRSLGAQPLRGAPALSQPLRGGFPELPRAFPPSSRCLVLKVMIYLG